MYVHLHMLSVRSARSAMLLLQRTERYSFHFPRVHILRMFRSLKRIRICFFLPLHFLFQTRNVCIKECTVTVFLGELCLQRSLFSLAHAQEVTFFLCFCLLFLLIGQQFFQARLLRGTLRCAFLMLSSGVFQFRPALLNAL